MFPFTVPEELVQAMVHERLRQATARRTVMLAARPRPVGFRLRAWAAAIRRRATRRTRCPSIGVPARCCCCPAGA